MTAPKGLGVKINNNRSGITAPPYSEADKEKAKRLYQQGYSLRQISEAINCPRHATIARWIAKFKWERKVGHQGPSVNSATGLPTGTKHAIKELVPPAVERYIAATVEKAVEKHLEAATKLQALGVAYLDQVAPRSMADVIQMIKSGIEIERQARGMEPVVGKGIDGKFGSLTGDTILTYVEKLIVQRKEESKTPGLEPVQADVVVNGAIPTEPEEPEPSEAPKTVN